MSHVNNNEMIPRESKEATDNGIGSKATKNPKYNKKSEKKCPKCNKIMKTERCNCEINSHTKPSNVTQN